MTAKIMLGALFAYLTGLFLVSQLSSYLCMFAIIFGASYSICKIGLVCLGVAWGWLTGAFPF
jgi:hypothetical protein